MVVPTDCNSSASDREREREREMERLMMWIAGNNIAVDDDLSSWEIINPSTEDDVVSLSFSESLSEKDPSSDDERLGLSGEDPQEDHQRSGFDQDMVPDRVPGPPGDLSPRDSSSDDHLWRFDDDQDGDQRPGFDDPGVRLGENIVPVLVPTPCHDRPSDSSSVRRQWRFDWDADKRPGLDEEVPEEDQERDERPGFDEHSVGLWEYTVKLIGLGQFDDPSSFNQWSRFDNDRGDELREKLVSPCNDQRLGLNDDLGDESGQNLSQKLVSPCNDQRSGLNDDRRDELGENLSRERASPYYDHQCGLDDCDERLLSEDDNDDVAYDFDDDLVPFYASGRFGKQRMGKVGKKVKAGKMKKKPKRMPRYFYNKVT